MPVSEQQQIAHYRLLHRLAFGGMSEVYLAFDTHREHNVALKLVETCQSYHCERLRCEAKTSKTLKHEHILPIFEYGEHEGYCYIAMPYIASGTLRERLQEGPLNTREVGELLQQLCDALHFAHTKGILHCDIKPSNILLDEDQYAYLADFGLVRIQHEHNDKTREIYSSGTPAYMAPELIQEPASVSSDIYATGVLLYQLLTGQLPFKSSSLLGMHWQHLHTQPAKPSTLNPAISSAIERVMLQALEKEPGKRFQTARDLALAYSKALADEQLLQERRTLVALQHRYRSRHICAALVVAFCFFPTFLGFSAYSLLGANSQTGEPGKGKSTVSVMFAQRPLITAPPTRSPSVINSGSGQSPVTQVSSTSSAQADSEGDEDHVVPVSPSPSPIPGKGDSDTPHEPPGHGHSRHTHAVGGEHGQSKYSL